MIKLMGMLRRKPGMSPQEFHSYWRNVHAPLVMEVQGFARHVRKYVQSHAVDAQLVPGDDGEPAFDGIAELWFDSLDDLHRAISDPCYLSEIHPDELKFLDFPNCVIVLVEEVSIR
ncbi:MAG: EthD domain-containing protein [Deltaproteobacteria bacterium]|nr:EthD domain-containing protein [Deltaproteobacteria bacterium]